jgi:tRNA methyltransferase complex GCD14 subunit
MVSFLDIHIAPPTSTNEPSSSQPPLEILESGTGHGSLTLHLARAIAAANPPPPLLSAPEQDWTVWRKTRRAILHSVEINEKTSTHAQKLIKGFRQGLYYPHIDFHASDVASWVSSQSRTGFLSYVLLDMPGVHRVVEDVVPAMKDDAMLMVFVPSITQIGDCVRAITEKKLPLDMVQVVEMGEGLSNGRYWDVRLVQKRAQERRSKVIKVDANKVDPEKAETLAEEFVQDRVVDDDGTEAGIDEAPVMVCRPRVGRLTKGACYVGLWRRRGGSNSP